MKEECFVYIIYNKDYDKFYIGQTNNLERRVFEHNNRKGRYTLKYSGKWILIYQEKFNTRTEAILKKQKNKNFYKKISGMANF